MFTLWSTRKHYDYSWWTASWSQSHTVRQELLSLIHEASPARVFSFSHLMSSFLLLSPNITFLLFKVTPKHFYDYVMSIAHMCMNVHFMNVYSDYCVSASSSSVRVFLCFVSFSGFNVMKLLKVSHLNNFVFVILHRMKWSCSVKLQQLLVCHSLFLPLTWFSFNNWSVPFCFHHYNIHNIL